MKQLEDIEKMDWQALEKAALQENASIPEGFGDRLADTLAAGRMTTAAPRRKADRRILWTSLAAAAALAALIAIPRLGNPEPEDTFDDPRLAYAEVEKAFDLISRKMAAGLEKAGEAKTLAKKPIQIINKQLQ